MRLHRWPFAAVAAIFAALLPVPLPAQWLNYPTPGIPRLPDGKANLAAPAPRTADGKPDLSGIWSGAGPLYRFNIAQDLQPEDIQPWAEALFLQRVRDSRKVSPLAKCMPVSVPYHDFFNLLRIVQTPAIGVTATGDLLYVVGLNEPKLPLLVQSETKFMSTATPTGFEFVKDAQGNVTHVIVRGATEEKAVRKSVAAPARPR